MPRRLFGAFIVSLVFLLTACSVKSDNLPTHALATLPADGADSAIEINKEIENAKNSGNLIIVALEKYNDNEGHYPETLSDLVPKYINIMPSTETGQEFRYLLLEPDNILGVPYNLSFDLVSNVNTGCTYLHELQTWDCSFYIDPNK